MITVDAKGKACPMPVILAKKELDAGAAELAVLVDNQTAVENLTRLGESKGYHVSAAGEGGVFRVLFTKDGDSDARDAAGPDVPLPTEGDWTLFVGNEGIGRDAPELAHNLMTMFFYTLSQSDALPSSILFLNGGVKLPTLNEQVVESLRTLEERGCEILVCGTCLNYHKLADRLQIGTVSNMYDIVSRMTSARKVLSL